MNVAAAVPVRDPISVMPAAAAPLKNGRGITSRTQGFPNFQAQVMGLSDELEPEAAPGDHDDLTKTVLLLNFPLPAAEVLPRAMGFAATAFPNARPVPTAPVAPAEIPAAPVSLPELAFAARLMPKTQVQTGPAAPVSHPDTAPCLAVQPEMAAADPKLEMPQASGDAPSGERHEKDLPRPRPSAEAGPEPAPNEAPVLRAAAPRAEVHLSAGQAPPPERVESTRTERARPSDAPHAAPRIETPALRPVAHAEPARDISLRLPDAGRERVELKLSERGGEVRVAVRTADANLAGSLRENLSDLVSRLEQSGFHTETWRPIHTASSSMDDGRRDGGSNQRDSSGSWDQGHAQHGNGGERRQQPSRARWLEEIERSSLPWLQPSIQ